MTLQEYRAEMLLHSTRQAKLLCEAACLEDAKIEPEQLRKNAATILSLMSETEDFLENLIITRSDSADSIAD